MDKQKISLMHALMDDILLYTNTGLRDADYTIVVYVLKLPRCALAPARQIIRPDPRSTVRDPGARVVQRS